MQNYTRRSLLSSSLATAATVSIGSAAATAKPQLRKGRIHQSVSGWCYPKIPLDHLCAFAVEIGLKGVDLLTPNDYEVPKRYGLRCTMGYVGDEQFEEHSNALNRSENHDEIERVFRSSIPRAAKAGVANVITFSGQRHGMSDEEGLRNTVAGLNRLKKLAEDNGINICLELLNSKVDHPDYMGDHTAWGVRVMEEVNSPNVKLLYDIYHMQIMEGDLIATIRRNIQWIGHFHTGGVPGRHELDDSQEVNWVGVMRSIAATNFSGYVAHEFLPTAADPLKSLSQAVDLCNV
jgi:hydroxypyruvate isomerase